MEALGKSDSQKKRREKCQEQRVGGWEMGLVGLAEGMAAVCVSLIPPPPTLSLPPPLYSCGEFTPAASDGSAGFNIAVHSGKSPDT